MSIKNTRKPVKNKAQSRRNRPVKKPGKQSPLNALKYMGVLFLLLALVLPVSWFINSNIELQEETKELNKQNEELLSKNRELISKLQASLEKATHFPESNQSESNLTENYLSEIEDYDKSKALLPPPPKSAPVLAIPEKKSIPSAHLSGKPKLVIIIDDVAYPHQLKAINALDIKITPSFFPSTRHHPKSSELAVRHPYHMVHLPLEAMRHTRAESNTLKTSDSKAHIEEAIAKLRREFPYAKHINNHTGSKFTADFESMTHLLSALEKHGFLFVDSRTTPRSKAIEAASAQDVEILSRDIFLDNKPDIAYIQNQLKKAVARAHKNGYAIAIGHPHHKTFEALATSHTLLSEVDIVPVGQLYDLLAHKE